MPDRIQTTTRGLFTQIWGNRYDFKRGHMADTPKRFAKMLDELTTQEEFDFTTFESERDEMVVMRDIDFHSLCAHHIIPFIGKCHIAYVPNGKIVGLSKLARTVRFHSAGLQVQEELTAQIADTLEDALEPIGVAVVMEAEHLCMTLRGVRSPGAQTITSTMRGCFADHDKLARGEFLQLIGKG